MVLRGDRWVVRPPGLKVMIIDVIRRGDHLRGVVGIDHVGIGADYDGCADMPVGPGEAGRPRFSTTRVEPGRDVVDLRKPADGDVWSVRPDREWSAPG